MRLLIVEDDALLREMLVNLLAADGYVVQGVGLLADAVCALRATPPPDVVLLDLGLPDGTAEDLARMSTAPVVVLSGGHRGAPVVGAAIVLEKPVSMAAIRVALIDAAGQP